MQSKLATIPDGDCLCHLMTLVFFTKGWEDHVRGEKFLEKVSC